ncbi:hypothetical protein KQY30_35840 [Streptomyces sp. GMY02]|uniref:hypothetical protein n=1 Tax=Streptomyces sp. GMY02 TaxID=1333528 RepID=UPI001C2C75B6|nr:hypothetical protein [Streptomyces sp. GMY02]QXE38779.1 hypothetical protein KQY30_35840 [Streptomyces sp. GMY02]
MLAAGRRSAVLSEAPAHEDPFDVGFEDITQILVVVRGFMTERVDNPAVILVGEVRITRRQQG